MTMSPMFDNPDKSRNVFSYYASELITTAWSCVSIKKLLTVIKFAKFTLRVRVYTGMS
jgi:hypothetical protein